MSYTRGEIFLLVVCVLVMCVVFTALGIGYFDCSDSGGSYVRGLFWMECI